MYYVNREQIEERLAFLPYLEKALRELAERRVAKQFGTIEQLAHERALHLVIETVTDVGSLLIDGFLMRDASSYEDIVEIVRMEGVLPDDLAIPLTELVMLRKPLVQQYATWERGRPHPIGDRLPELLSRFAEAVRAYLQNSL